MNVVWKRPDGYHGASPQDYRVIEINAEHRIWLHKHDQSNFPFRVSGGWQDEAETTKLNTLVNLLDEPKHSAEEQLTTMFHHSRIESVKEFKSQTLEWLKNLRATMKGDQWEKEIMDSVFLAISGAIENL